MGSLWSGAKAGLVGGLAYGAITAITTSLTMRALKAQIIDEIEKAVPAGSPITAEQIYLFTVTVGPIFVALIGVLIGGAVGAIFGWIYERLPGRTSHVKGIVFSLILFFIFTLLGLSNISYGLTYFLSNLVTNLLSALIYGFILGILYRRFTLEALAEDKKRS